MLLTVPVRRSSKAVFNYGELWWKKPAQRSEFLGHAAAEVGIRHLVCRGVGTEDLQFMCWSSGDTGVQKMSLKCNPSICCRWIVS